mmetsp:Transcript_32305/g.49976  ORF Transcript_32305/g.49976 Transcript_32305/m.49976 type:complete len:253 (-) Transcript_32305:584-1342(-)
MAAPSETRPRPHSDTRSCLTRNIQWSRLPPSKSTQPPQPLSEGAATVQLQPLLRRVYLVVPGRPPPRARPRPRRGGTASTLPGTRPRPWPCQLREGEGDAPPLQVCGTRGTRGPPRVVPAPVPPCCRRRACRFRPSPGRKFRRRRRGASRRKRPRPPPRSRPRPCREGTPPGAPPVPRGRRVFFRRPPGPRPRRPPPPAPSSTAAAHRTPAARACVPRPPSSRRARLSPRRRGPSRRPEGGSRSGASRQVGE